jgi:hypothetical protein
MVDDETPTSTPNEEDAPADAPSVDFEVEPQSPVEVEVVKTGPAVEVAKAAPGAVPPDPPRVRVEQPSPSTDVRTKWFGVLPAGSKPLPSKSNYLLQVLAVVAAEFIIWGIYRYTTAEYLMGFGSTIFYTSHIIAAPLLGLSPVII